MYTFGEFELDPRSYQLRRGGEVLPLQPKVLELLAYLARHHERVVAKEELFAALWPEVHVGESSLTWCVSQARKALGQRRADRGPIETVHGRGYRFTAELAASEPPRSPSLRPSLAPPPGPAFVGRRQAMAVLRRSLDRVRQGGAGAGHLLSGEAGIGKTRCAELLAAEARATGIQAWVGRCLDAEGTPPFWPWIQILRSALDDRLEAPLRQRVEEVLAALLPRDAAAPEQEFDNGRSDGFWILERLVRLLLESVAGAPRLIVVDDLHWIDRASLRALQLIATDLPRHPLLILATIRDTDVPSEPSTEPAVERLARHLVPVPLTGLELDEVEAVLEGVTGHPSPPETVREVHRRTGGNPLFVQEMARRLVERPDAGPGELGELSGARSLVAARLERRDPEVARALGAASVLGQEFDLPVLAAMLAITPEATGALLDGALRARLVERRTSAGRYAFTHALVRDAVHASLSESARCTWHRLAGEALEARAIDDERVTQLAFHFHQALPVGTYAKALRYSAAAAQASARLFAHEEALAHWRRAAEAIELQPGQDPGAQAASRCLVLVGLGTTELHLGRRTQAREHLKRAIALASERGQAAHLLAAARGLRHSLVSHLGLDPRARAAITQALPGLTTDRERATALTLLGAAPDRDAADRALAIARGLGGQALLEALWARAHGLTGPDDVDALLETTSEMRALDGSLGRSWWSGEARYGEFCAHAQRGDAAAMDAALEDLRRLSVACRLPEALWNVDRLVAQVHIQRGDLAEGERQWEELARRPGLADLPYVQHLVRVHREAMHVARGGGPEASMDFWRLVSQWNPSPRAHALHVTALLEAGRRDEARTRLDQLVAPGLDALPRDRVLLATLAALGRAAVALDDRPLAAQIEARLAPYAALAMPDLFTSTAGSVAHPLGLLAAYRGDLALARERLQLAVARHREMRLASLLAQSERELAALATR